MLDIQVDGGICPENAGLVASKGANWLVAGSSLFCAANRPQVFKDIYEGAIKNL